MVLIWCSISSHGFGHAAQVVPVLNELGRQIPGLKAILRTTLPAGIFQDWLQIPWELSEGEQDVGCRQQGPLVIDVPATWAAHLDFHRTWEKRLEAETEAIRSRAPALVLTDISHLAAAAGARAGVRTVGLCNLSWDTVLERYRERDRRDHLETIRLIRQAYDVVDLLIRPAPCLPLPAFRRIRDINPIACPQAPDKSALRSMIGAQPGESTVLIGFGGIALNQLPYEQLESLAGYRFLVFGPVPSGLLRVHQATPSPPHAFRSRLASADLLVTKPGYNTVVEAVASGVPVVYVRRFNFADEQSLVDYLHHYGRTVELPRADFDAGRWSDALDKIQKAPSPAEAPPAPTGASEAADILTGFLR